MVEKEILKVCKKLRVNFEIIDFKDVLAGYKVELEHGKKNRKTNITNDDVIMTTKIVLAHLSEFPDYYKRLKKMEDKAKKFWGDQKFSIFY